MALPPPQLPDAGPPDAESPARRFDPRLLGAIGGVAGIVVGLLIGSLAFGGDDQPAQPEGGAADAAAGCLLLDGFPDEIPDRPNDEDDPGWGVDGPYFWRVQGAASSFQAASAEDRKYRSLGEDGETLNRAMQTFEVDDANKALAALNTWCEDNA